MSPGKSDLSGAVWNAMRNLTDSGRTVSTPDVRHWIGKFFPHWGMLHEYSAKRVIRHIRRHAREFRLVERNERRHVSWEPQ